MCTLVRLHVASYAIATAVVALLRDKTSCSTHQPNLACLNGGEGVDALKRVAAILQHGDHLPLPLRGRRRAHQASSVLKPSRRFCQRVQKEGTDLELRTTDTLTVKEALQSSLRYLHSLSEGSHSLLLSWRFEFGARCPPTTMTFVHMTFDPIIPDPARKMAEVQEGKVFLECIPVPLFCMSYNVSTVSPLAVANPFSGSTKDVTVSGKTLKYFDLAGIGKDKFGQSSGYCTFDLHCECFERTMWAGTLIERHPVKACICSFVVGHMLFGVCLRFFSRLSLTVMEQAILHEIC